MKYLLVLLVVGVALYIWRANRKAEREEAAPPPPPPTAPRTPAQMLACARCGVHLPAADAVPGQRGSYCSVDHRRLTEG